MKRELDIIMELMKELEEKMKYGEEDFNHRLGRKSDKPKIEVKIEELPMDEDIEEFDEMLEESPEESLEESPEESLKKRLMKLRSR